MTTSPEERRALAKTRINVRLDDDVLERFREQADAARGASYSDQTLINQALLHG